MDLKNPAVEGDSLSFKEEPFGLILAGVFVAIVTRLASHFRDLKD